ncbi:MAG: (deoxy)nucleoside triphosphate pyrophosphohydrolase [Pseudomonadota bacterium]
MDGKKSDTQQGFVLVVAGALRRSDGRWLMHLRPLEKHHGGLWEFPGGKVEPLEIPVKSLKRELYEELGTIIAAEDCTPVAFAEEASEPGRKPIVILLYKIARWSGTPKALEGGRIGWFTQEEIAGLVKPPLDEVLTAQLFKDADKAVL